VAVSCAPLPGSLRFTPFPDASTRAIVTRALTGSDTPR
jgi:hypothetical protein